MNKLIDEITEYLASGGLFNPEMADHDKVRDLLIRCRAALPQWRDVREELPEEYAECLVYSSKYKIYCSTMKLNDMRFECMERGELLSWMPTHWMPLPAAPGGHK